MAPLSIAAPKSRYAFFAHQPDKAVKLTSQASPSTHPHGIQPAIRPLLRNLNAGGTAEFLTGSRPIFSLLYTEPRGGIQDAGT